MEPQRPLQDDDNPLNKILGAVTDSLADAWAFIKYPMETIAAKTALAYWKIMLAGTVKMFPALAVFMIGQTTIAPEPVRKPDEHLQSQSLTTDTTLEGANLFNVANTSSMVSVRVSDDVPVSGWEFAATVEKTPSPPASPGGTPT